MQILNLNKLGPAPVLLALCLSSMPIRALDYPSAVINTSNLLAYWQFDPVYQTNSCVNGYQGTLHGNAQIGPPGSGCPLALNSTNQGLLLDGTNSYLTTTLTGQITNQGTILAWVYLTAQPATAGHIFQIASQAKSGDDFDLQIQTDNKTYFFTDSGGSTVYAQALSLNQWHFVAATFITNSARCIYLDGQLVASSIAGSHATNNTALWIGNNSLFGPRLFQGRLDEVAVFNRALAASEIASLFFISQGSVVSWTNPGAISYGNPLTTNQLNAAANVPGTFAYNPPSGTVLAVGTNILSVIFTPTDTVDYSSVTDSVSLVVQACVSPPSRIVSWWYGDGNAADIVGANNGTLVGGVTFTNGEVGQAFNFNGSTAWVDIPNTAALNPTGPFSVECWVKAYPTQSSSSFLVVDKSHGFTDGTGWLMQGNTASGTVGFGYGLGGSSGASANFIETSTPKSILDSQWHHLAGVWTGTQIQIYLDGVLQGTANETAPPVNNARDVEIGSSWGGGTRTRFFNGLVDEVTYYSTALTANEVAAIYSAGVAGKCKSGIPPTILTQAANQSVSPGGTAQFNILANGSAPLFYQWWFNQTNLLAGATNTTLTLNNVSNSLVGVYSVVVTNVYGVATSTPVSLALLKGTPVLAWTNPVAITYGAALGLTQLNAGANVSGTFTYNPSNGAVLNAGTNALTVVFTPLDTTNYSSATGQVSLAVSPAPFSVTASNATRAYGQGNPAFGGKLAGLVNGDNITANYSCSAVAISPPGSYSIVPGLVDPNSRLSNYLVASTNGILTVTAGPLPTLTGITPNAALTNGGTSVTLAGSGFELGAGVTVGGNPATAVTVNSGTQITAVTPVGPLGAVNAVMTNPDGTSATLTNGFTYTGAPPSILTQPTNRLVIQGSNAVFQVSAQYAGGYQWTFNNGNLADNSQIIGSHSNVLTIVGAQLANVGNYQVLVTNGYGATNSAVAVLTVLATNPPAIFNVSAAPTVQGGVITWQTDVPAYDQVVYGNSTNYTATNTLSGTLVTLHSVTLSGLTPNTLYHFDLLVFDQTQNQSGDLTFTTLSDTTPPVASLNAVASTVCSLPYTFTWTGTDNVTPATNLVFAYQLDSQGWTAFGSATSLQVSQLADGQHTFSVKARDVAGNVSSPASAGFSLETTAPVIFGLANAPADEHCVITWQTAEPTEALVNYGATSAYGQSVSSGAFVTSHSISLTNLQASATYHFQVTAQDACGRQVSSADVQFNTLPAPDLQVASVTAPTNVWTGAGFVVSWVDTNTGPGLATGPWVDKVYLSLTNRLNITNDILLDQFTVSGTLDPGQAAPQSQLIILSETAIASGSYYLSVLADAGNAVYEVTKTNNTGITPASIYVNQTPLPALAVSAVTAPTNAMGGQPVTVGWTVCNQGGGGTGTPLWYDHLYLSPTTNIANAIEDYGTFANPGYLLPEECYDQIATVTLPGGVSGNYYFIVRSDSTGLLTQQTTSGNTGYSAIPINIQLVTAGFFHVASVAVAPAPPTVTWSGQTVTCTYVVQNTGQSPITGSWDDRITLSSVSNYLNGITTAYAYENFVFVEGPLLPGAAYTNSAQFILPQSVAGTNLSGTWYVVPVVDIHFQAGGAGIGTGTIARDELAAPIDLTAPPPADLVVTSVSAPANAAQSQAINLQWVVANQGVYATSVNSWYDAVWLSTNPVFNAAQSILLGIYSHFGTLGLSASYTNNLNVFIPANILTAGQSSATNYVFLVADAGNAVTEITKTNNVLAAAPPLVVVPAYPADLAVVQVQAPATLVAGTTATITWAVTNLGAGTTSVSNWTDSVWLSPAPTLNPATEIHLADVPHNGFLASGAAYTQSQTVNLPNCDNGSFYVIVIADSGQVVNGDGITFNHLLATAGPSVVWPDPAARLEVSALTPPVTAQAGNSLALAWTVQNPGNAATSAAWFDAVYLSPTPQFVPANSTLLGFYLHTNGLAPGASYQQSPSPAIPACVSGSYYVVAVADAGGVVNAATCYTNNVLVSPAPVNILPGSFASLQVLGLNVPAGVTSGIPWTVQWSVTNAGPSAAASPWSDAVYASLLPTLDTNALLLSRFVYSNSLASGGSYAQTQFVSLPSCLSGNYNIFVVADMSNAVNLAACLVGNEAASTNAVTVTYGLYPNLVTTAIGNPASAVAGQAMTVSWSVTNTGLATATGPWTDSVYLTPSSKFTPTNGVLLGNYPQTGAIAAGAGYSQSTSFTIPNTNGTFYVVVVVDSGGAVQQCQPASNDVAYSLTPVNLPATLYPDLKVTSVQVPASAYAGQNINVTWVVTNEGTQATPAANWSDTLYLSGSQSIGTGTVTLGSHVAPGSLAVGQTYTNTATLQIPPGFAGPYYVLVLADSGRMLYERLGYNDSLGWNAAPLVVNLPPPADLVATSASITPSSGLPGTNVTIGWAVTNPAANAALAAWSDALYLSTNHFWDLSAVPLALANHSGLGANAGYNASWTGPLPALTPGSYYALVRADIRDTVNELTLTNNTAVSTSAISLDVPVLTLGQPVTNNLATGAAQFYKFNVPANVTVAVTVAGGVTNAANELFVRYGAVPDLGHYDFVYNNPLGPNQQITIPATAAGWYYVMVRGGSEPGGPLAYTLEAAAVPLGITSISATQIGDNGQVTLTFSGAEFEPGAVVQLISGTNTYYPQTSIFKDSTSLTATFQFTHAVDGLYDVVLNNPDSTSTRNAQAVMIEPVIPLDAEAMPGPIDTQPRNGLPFTWTGAVSNAGNVDIQYLAVLVYNPPAYPILLTPPAGALDADINSLDNSYNGCFFYLRNLAVGGTASFSFSISGFGNNQFSYDIVPTAQSKADFLQAKADEAEELRESLLNPSAGIATNLSTLPADLAAAVTSTNAFAIYFAAAFTNNGVLDADDLNNLPAPSSPLPDVAAGIANSGQILGKSQTQLTSTPKANNLRQPKTTDINCAESCLNTFDITLSQLRLSWIAAVNSTTSHAGQRTADITYDQGVSAAQRQCNACVQQCGYKPPFNPPPPNPNPNAYCGDPQNYFVCPRDPRDPNELNGPTGYGSAAYVGVQIPWQFTTYFVNESNATAYASQIAITNFLDPSFDIRSFRVSRIVLGNVAVTVATNRSFVQIRVPAPYPNPSNVVVDVSVGVDVTDNLIYCTLNAVDVNTGQSVTSANEGVLPPNTANNIGQGYLVYSIRPKAGVPTGTIITNQASIIFAPNAPLVTGTTTNTVDGVPPTSSMVPLASAQTATNFTLVWYGFDDPNGSGVASYDIYLSDNNGPWRILQINETTSSLVFGGVPGHSYGFYSAAHDNAGNVEQKTPHAEAMTFVSSNTAPVMPALANQTTRVGNQSLISGAALAAGGGSQLTYSLLNAPPGMTINATNGNIYWSPLPSQAGSTNLVTVQVANNGVPPLSASESFLAIVGDYAALTLGSGGVNAGQTICLPLNLVSSANLTNLIFTLGYPTNRLGGLTLSPALSQIGSLQTMPLDAAHAQVTLQTVPGMSLVGTQEVASVCLTAATNQSSGIATVTLSLSNASELNGTTPATLAAWPGTIVVVAGHPFLTVAPAGQGQVQLTLYGDSGSNYILQSSSSLNGPWTPVNTFNLSGNSQSVWLNDQATNGMFYRMEQQ